MPCQPFCREQQTDVGLAMMGVFSSVLKSELDIYFQWLLAVTFKDMTLTVTRICVSEKGMSRDKKDEGLEEVFFSGQVSLFDGFVQLKVLMLF